MTQVSVRQAQEAAVRLGPARTEEIVGGGGLSGASAEALARLVAEDLRERMASWHAQEDEARLPAMSEAEQIEWLQDMGLDRFGRPIPWRG